VRIVGDVAFAAGEIVLALWHDNVVELELRDPSLRLSAQLRITVPRPAASSAVRT